MLAARESTVAGEIYWGLDARSLALDGCGEKLERRRDGRGSAIGSTVAIRALLTIL